VIAVCKLMRRHCSCMCLRHAKDWPMYTTSITSHQSCSTRGLHSLQIRRKMQLPRGRANIHRLRVLSNHPVLLLSTPTTHVPPRKIERDFRRLASFDVHALEAAQDNLRIIRTAKREVELCYFISIDGAGVRHLHGHGVEIFP
jgi:hypothetical protein